MKIVFPKTALELKEMSFKEEIKHNIKVSLAIAVRTIICGSILSLCIFILNSVGITDNLVQTFSLLPIVFLSSLFINYELGYLFKTLGQ